MKSPRYLPNFLIHTYSPILKNLYKCCEIWGYSLCAKLHRNAQHSCLMYLSRQKKKAHRGWAASKAEEVACWLPAQATSPHPARVLRHWMGSCLATVFMPTVTPLWQALWVRYPAPSLPSALMMDHWSIMGPEEKYFPDFFLDRDG